MNNYKMIILVGKAGSGKDTILRELVKNNPYLHEIVSCTTRPPREGEVDGVNYHFLSGEEFAEKVLNNEMLEATCFNDWFYGTGYQSLDENKINVGVFNPTGVESILAYKNIDAHIFFIDATDKNRLIRQLNREENPDVDEIIRRYKADMIDFEFLEFKHIELPNNTKEDLLFNVDFISDYIGKI